MVQYSFTLWSSIHLHSGPVFIYTLIQYSFTLSSSIPLLYNLTDAGFVTEWMALLAERNEVTHQLIDQVGDIR